MAVRELRVVIMPTLITLISMQYTDKIIRSCDEAVGLLMTYRCNLNCKYCYIHTKRNKDMTLELAQKILEPILNKDNGVVDITFMGGETLMAIKVIRPLVDWAERRSWKRHYRFLGATNGTLLDSELKEWLWKHRNNFTLGLSYDGIPAVQDENRGYSDIDLDFFIKTWPHQPIQMTINEASVSKMADGVIYLLERGAEVHPNVAFEQHEWSNKSIAEYGRQLNKLVNYYITHNDKPFVSQFIHNLNEYAACIDNPKPQLEVCGAGNGFQVFDVDGQSYPCHILSPLVLSANQLHEIRRGLITKTTDFSDTECKNCPYTSSCPTCIGCNYLYRGKLQKRDKTHCRVMRQEVKAYMKMEILRLKAKECISPEDATEIDSIRKLYNYEKSLNRHL